MSMVEHMLHMVKAVRCEWTASKSYLTCAGYGMPIDGDELDRIDMKHRMYSMLLDEELFLAPIGSSPHRVLDLGTGSGRSNQP